MSELQRTIEWHTARLGRLTASRIADATARTKTGWGSSRANYMAELLIERLTGEPAPRYTNAAMDWGTQYESEAITVYEFEKNATVDPIGFCPHPRIADSGASPDGMIGLDGLIECKCPQTATHIDILLGASIDEKYIKQMQWQMACTGRRWCDWMSYDPRVPVNLRVVIRRVERDDAMIAKLEKDVAEFLNELAEKHCRLLALGNGKGDPTLTQLKASVELAGAQ
jgi:putative phage-type endonuclease